MKTELHEVISDIRLWAASPTTSLRETWYSAAKEGFTSLRAVRAILMSQSLLLVRSASAPPRPSQPCQWSELQVLWLENTPPPLQLPPPSHSLPQQHFQQPLYASRPIAVAHGQLAA